MSVISLNSSLTDNDLSPCINCSDLTISVAELAPHSEEWLANISLLQLLQPDRVSQEVAPLCAICEAIAIRRLQKVNSMKEVVVPDAEEDSSGIELARLTEIKMETEDRVESEGEEEYNRLDSDLIKDVSSGSAVAMDLTVTRRVALLPETSSMGATSGVVPVLENEDINLDHGKEETVSTQTDDGDVNGILGPDKCLVTPQPKRGVPESLGGGTINDGNDREGPPRVPATALVQNNTIEMNDRAAPLPYNLPGYFAPFAYYPQQPNVGGSYQINSIMCPLPPPQSRDGRTYDQLQPPPYMLMYPYPHPSGQNPGFFGYAPPVPGGSHNQPQGYMASNNPSTLTVGDARSNSCVAVAAPPPPPMAQSNAMKTIAKQVMKKKPPAKGPGRKDILLSDFMLELLTTTAGNGLMSWTGLGWEFTIHDMDKVSQSWERRSGRVVKEFRRSLGGSPGLKTINIKKKIYRFNDQQDITQRLGCRSPTKLQAKENLRAC